MHFVRFFLLFLASQLLGRLTVNQSQIAALLRTSPVWCAGCGPDVSLGDAKRVRVYCATALLEILEEPAPSFEPVVAKADRG
jgi:hypothetical protein